jgi:Flp pilus assembly protein TadB
VSAAFLWAALGLLVVPGRPTAQGRLTGLGLRGNRSESGHATKSGTAALGGLAVAGAVLTFRTDSAGMICAAVAGAAVSTAARPWLATRAASAPSADLAGLPLALDLIAAALRSGAGLPGAVGAVAAAPGLSAGPALARAATMLRLGADPAEAWSQFTPSPEAALLGAVATRSARSGTRLAQLIGRQADLMRAESAAAAVRRAHRAGAITLLPLGLCYLPAFVCLGIVPMVAGLAGQLTR